MGHSFSFRRLGEDQHPHLTMLACGNVPTQVVAFPWCYCLMTLHFLKPWIGYPYLRSVKIACTFGTTRSCFYPQHSAVEPVHDSVSKVLYCLERSIFEYVTLKYST